MNTGGRILNLSLRLSQSFIITPIQQQPDPAKDRAELDRAEAFIATRFCPMLEAAAPRVEYKAECVHFATDADSVAAIVEARAIKLKAAAVVLAKHASKSKLKQLFLGSTAKHLVSSCPVPVVVLHA